MSSSQNRQVLIPRGPSHPPTPPGFCSSARLAAAQRAPLAYRNAQTPLNTGETPDKRIQQTPLTSALYSSNSLENNNHMDLSTLCYNPFSSWCSKCQCPWPN